MADRRKLVLIVDDDQAVRDALQFALRLEGLCVHVHSGGAALLADPDLARAGCVILGDRMRQMDGFALLSNLKERDISLPAIMLTSHATPRVQARADAARRPEGLGEAVAGQCAGGEYPVHTERQRLKERSST